ncbi:MAG: hypothetical protein FWG18_03945, partial [Alphaproteobacteria bacterium]|nr:hypothetical protein [Alphaproteobacteria bacterium]
EQMKEISGFGDVVGLKQASENAEKHFQILSGYRTSQGQTPEKRLEALKALRDDNDLSKKAIEKEMKAREVRRVQLEKGEQQTGTRRNEEETRLIDLIREIRDDIGVQAGSFVMDPNTGKPVIDPDTGEPKKHTRSTKKYAELDEWNGITYELKEGSTDEYEKKVNSSGRHVKIEKDEHGNDVEKSVGHGDWLSEMYGKIEQQEYRAQEKKNAADTADKAMRRFAGWMARWDFLCGGAFGFGGPTINKNPFKSRAAAFEEYSDTKIMAQPKHLIDEDFGEAGYKYEKDKITGVERTGTETQKKFRKDLLNYNIYIDGQNVSPFER